ncbi:MAG: aldolase catalytic domain-containing protein [Deltaproteobacteria bacterium]|nr:aldolase catalytic domain-containing protein [Deltaproteobacteria bacterium]
MKKTESKDGFAQQWLSYRPEIKVIDVTIRDGGLMNDHRFSDDVVRGVYNACVAAGIDYMELGYKSSSKSFSAQKYGPWKFCSEDDMRRIVGDNKTDLKLCVMADAERCDYHEDILPKKDSVLDMVRIATYIHQIPTALDMVKDAHDKGYETAVNLMAASTVAATELEGAMELICNSEVDVVYLVDSFGSFYSEQVHYLLDLYKKSTAKRGKTLGMHAHNNQQLAYANTIEAAIKGANLLDSSMAGLGRGAGNCQTELLLGFLHNPKYQLRPVLQCIQEHIEPLRAELGWGFDIPYMITGMLNQHPRSAMAFNASENRGNLVKFYDSVVLESE